MEEPLLDTAAGGTTEYSNKQLMYEGESEDYAPVRSFGELRQMFWIETVKLWRIGGSAVITIMCMYGTNSVIVLFAGHLGTIELSAISISLSVISTFTYGFMLGMGSALETLCGQAFGAGQVHMLGIYMQRSCIILFVTSFLLLPIYIFATPVLKWLGQEDDIANEAGKFTLQIIPQLFSLAINFPAQKFLQAQRKVKVLAWIAVLALLIHIGMLALFIYVFDWGTSGAAVSFNITRWGISIAQVVYIMGWCKEGWTGFSWLAFNEIWAFVRLSLASAVMLCLEIWYMMSILLLTGGLSDAVIAVDSLSICMNINGWEGMLFIGLNAAISVRVSNELGLRRPRAAKYAVYVTVSQSLLIGLLFMVIILITKDYFAVIFTSDKVLQQAVAKLAYLLGITMVLNSVQPVISGVAIGGGWQAMVAYINLGCYYIFGLPLGYVLCHVANLGVAGLWEGMICGTALQTIILLIILYKTNWNKELGMGSALETLCGQAFGAGQVHMLGIYMQRSCIILFVTAFLLLPTYIFATPILKWLGQEDDIANEAGKFTLQIIPQLFSLAINFPAQKFLKAQRKVKVLAWIAVLALVIHIGMLALFMYVFDWGTMGAAVSFNLTRWGISIAQAVYIMGSCKEGWTGFSWLAFNEIWAFVRLSLASAVMLCLEIWYMMSILILTGGLSDAVIAVGSLSICMNINGWETMLFVGINAAISVRVSNKLGLRRPRTVKYAVYVTVSQSLLLGLLFMIIILITKDDFAVIFTVTRSCNKRSLSLHTFLV
ncbi:hypothetical protein DVH24_022518 [Malus domestica]|uniref:Protein DETOXIFICATION n=1 Tax=Malus domestica TaxID=3750 RepID=A0A498KPL9_MALDO|nr:hypothetical protein DVH24_022518 [Malus domestica]